MDLLESLINELGKQNFLNLSIITELNHKVLCRLEPIYLRYLKDKNIYFLTQELVLYGSELESLNNSKSDKILEIQMSWIYNLLSPVIFKLKQICFYLLNELVDDIKKTIDKYLELLSGTTFLHSKCLKFIQTNSSVAVLGYGKEYQMTKLADTNFNEFGITIKITNPNYKNQLNQLIGLFQIFTLPDKSDVILWRKFDWVWKINQTDLITINFLKNFSPSKNLILLSEQISLLDGVSGDKTELVLDIIHKINLNSFSDKVITEQTESEQYIQNQHIVNQYTSDENVSNSPNENLINTIEPMGIENILQMENFQIVQSSGQTKGECDSKAICIELIDNTEVQEQISLYGEVEKKKNRRKNKSDNKDKDNFSSNLKIVEDQSFILPIENTNFEHTTD